MNAATNADSAQPPCNRQPPPPRRSLVILAGIAAAFLLLRVPLMYRQYGGIDEEWYAVPGWTVAQEGIPRIPYTPSRQANWIYYRADEALFALPPGYFYWQAPFFLLLPAGYGTARLASGVAGLIAVWLVYCLGRAFYRDEAAGLWGAGLYSLSRTFYFPAQTARPDMLCGALGLAAVLAMWRWQIGGRWRYLVTAGILLGLAALTHPFAAALAVQLGVWALIAGRGFRGRLGAVAILIVCTLGVLALWLPLIFAYPDAFQGQFFTNVLDRSGPGVLQRFVFPWSSLASQAAVIVERAMPLQAGLMFFGLVGATLIDLRRRQRGPIVALALTWSGIYTLATFAGVHPGKGYWCYPAALMFLCVGRTITVVSRREMMSLRRPLWQAGIGLLAALAMIPGSGLRTWAAHVRNWSDIRYNSPRFVETMLRDLPHDARLTVDRAYVFDIYLAGRPTILALSEPLFFEGADFPYDYLIVGPFGLEIDTAEKLGGEFLRAYGTRADFFACYAEIYTPAPRTKARDSTAAGLLPSSRAAAASHRRQQALR
ncbi:MAG: glycosyltransferase family 39 protein [Rhodopirellula sp.]|nr:glycosyltransferase family 39 protein [Rhodopirellula sp.]